MTNERYKQLMIEVGLPNSRSLLQALKTVANEVAQEAYTLGASDMRERAAQVAIDSNDLLIAEVIRALEIK